MVINKNLMNVNHTAMKRGKDDIKFIVLHYVGALGDARQNTNYYKSQYVGASADFWVGFAGDIWQGNDYYNYYSWHCGGGLQGSGGASFYKVCTNSNSVGIEMCVHKKSTRTMNATDRDWYFEDATIDSAAQLTAKLMKELNVGIDHVIRHYDVVGKICPNPFVYNTGKVTWEGFKKMVKDYYDGKKNISITDYAGKESSTTTSSTVYYRVRKTWADEKSQLGAYTVLENAKANCPDGYYVFDEKGNVVYPKKTENKNTASKDAKGIPASKQDYIDKVSKIAVNLYKETKILPSVIVAQTCLETGYGLGKDSTLLMEVNNLLGMKAELLSSTWAEFSVWNGKSITKRTPEVYNGVLTYINDKFRVYTDYENCIRDYEMFLLHVKNGSGYKYRKVAGMTDPREVITAISRGGYATDPSYITKVMKLIEENDLTKYDKQAGVNAKTETKTATDTATKSTKVTPYRVGTGWKSGSCVGQVGAYAILANAKQRADELGAKYYVYDNNGKQVYQGKTVTKTVAEKAVEWALKTAADNSHGYNNTSGQRLGNPDYACSSFVAGAYRAAGLTSIPADSYTASMYKTFTAAGFEDVTSKVNLRTGAGTIAGDVVLRPGVHVEMVVNDKHQLVGARGNATGGATNGRAGDQGGEIEVANWWDDQWKYCLRYAKDAKTATQKAAETAAKTTTTKYVVQAGLFTVKQNADNLAKFIKKKGFDVLVVPYKGQYCVQCGIFAVKKNANTLVSKLKNAGFDALVRAEKS